MALLATFVFTLTAWTTGKAAADAPIRTGWWNAANTGTVAPPPPPDVQDDNLYVAGGPPGGAPSAFSAVLIALPDGQTAKTLTLTPANTPSPNLAVQACLIPSGDFPSGGNQQVSAAPTVDCTSVQPAPGQVDAASGAVTFAIGPIAAAAPTAPAGKLALAIEPVGPTDRVAFANPDANSVALQASSDASTESSTGDTLTAPSDATAGSSSSSPSATPTYGSATTGGFDSSSSLSSGSSPANPPAAAAAPPANDAGSATAAAAGPASGSAARSTGLPEQAFASSHRSDTATKVGGALALGLLIAALIAYIRGFGLMGGRIAD